MIGTIACLSAEEIGISKAVSNCSVLLVIGIALTLLILSWQRSDFRWLPLNAALVLAHPAWWMSEYMGDCGYAKRFMCFAISVVFAAMLLCQVFLPRLHIRWFLLIASGTCWVAYAASRLYWQIVDQTWLLDFLSSIFPPAGIEAFLFASPTLLWVAVVGSVASALLYGVTRLWSGKGSFVAL